MTCKVNNKARRRSPTEQIELNILVTVIVCHNDEKGNSKLKSQFYSWLDLYCSSTCTYTKLCQQDNSDNKLCQQDNHIKETRVHVLRSDTDDEPLVSGEEIQA